MMTLGMGRASTDLRGMTLSGGKPVADAVVWLEASGPARSERSEVVLDQRNLTFSPRVLAVRVGTRIKFPNNDRVFHNAFSFHDSEKFDLGLYPVGTVKHVLFDRPGLSRVFCNIHPGMAAYVMVVDSSYFAVSDREGAFVIPSVPAGSYRYRAWRPGGDTLSGTLVAAPDALVRVSWP